MVGLPYICPHSVVLMACAHGMVPCPHVHAATGTLYTPMAICTSSPQGRGERAALQGGGRAALRASGMMLLSLCSPSLRPARACSASELPPCNNDDAEACRVRTGRAQVSAAVHMFTGILGGRDASQVMVEGQQRWTCRQPTTRCLSGRSDWIAVRVPSSRCLRP